MSEGHAIQAGEPMTQPPDELGWLTRFWLRAPAWPLLLVGLLGMLEAFWEYRDPRVALRIINYPIDFCLGFVAVVALVGARALQLVIRISVASMLGDRANGLQSRRLFWPWVLVLPGLTYFALVEHWPMRVAFHLSRPWLEAIADEAAADPAKAQQLVGRWAGLYEVAGVEVIGRSVILYLGRDKGSYGFARVPGAARDVIVNNPQDDPRHHSDFPKQDQDQEGRRIWGDWFVMYSFYWLIKDGWS